MPTQAEYFAHWTDPANGPLIEEYMCLAYGGIMSLRLNVPADWGRLFVPGQPQHGGVHGDANSLPRALSTALTAAGFIAGSRSMARSPFPRPYILRPHGFPITIATYRSLILPHLRRTTNGVRIPRQDMFNNALALGYAAWRQHSDQLRAFSIPQWVDMIDREFAA